jgi:hypothetical protein
MFEKIKIKLCPIDETSIDINNEIMPQIVPHEPGMEHYGPPLISPSIE